jgi:hypothetical protein
MSFLFLCLSATGVADRHRMGWRLLIACRVTDRRTVHYSTPSGFARQQLQTHSGAQARTAVGDGDGLLAGLGVADVEEDPEVRLVRWCWSPGSRVGRNDRDASR